MRIWHRPNTLTNGYWDSKSMHKHADTYIYTCIYMHTYTYTYTHADIYIYTYTYIHTYTHTHATCAYAHMQARLDRQRIGDCTRSWYNRQKLRTSRSFNAINHIEHLTSNARTSYCPLPETPIPLKPPSPLPNIPQNSSRTAASAVLLFHTDATKESTTLK